MANQVLEPRLPRAARRVAAGETCRMFESDFLERFSRIHPATPFVVWLPVAVVFVTRSALRHDLAPLAIPALFLLGAMIADREEVNVETYRERYAEQNAILLVCEERVGLMVFRPDLFVNVSSLAHI